MAMISSSKARSLCTESEYNLFKWSSAKKLNTLSPSQLKQKLERARKLRSKYRDLAKQQRGEARGKRKPTGTRAAKGNERTVEKAQLFDEVLERFEQAMKDAEAGSKETSKTAKKKTKRPNAAGKSADRKTRKKSKRAAASATDAKAEGRKSTRKPAKKAAKAMKASDSASGSTEGRKSKRAAASAARPVALAAGATVTTPALSADAGHESPFGSLVQSSGKTDINARRTRRLQSSKAAKAGRIESRFARTVQEKIQGHISGQTKRNQARRDTKS